MKTFKIILLIAAMAVGAIGAGSLSYDVLAKEDAKWKTTCVWKCDINGDCKLAEIRCETGGMEPRCESCPRRM